MSPAHRQPHTPARDRSAGHPSGPRHRAERGTARPARPATSRGAIGRHAATEPRRSLARRIRLAVAGLGAAGLLAGGAVVASQAADASVASPAPAAAALTAATTDAVDERVLARMAESRAVRASRAGERVVAQRVVLEGKPEPEPPAPSDPRDVAASMLGQYGFGADQFGCLDALWTRESGWNPYADNPTSSAYGIPQALPGSKMASAGADWATDPATQIAWGLGYIRDVYGSPCAAWSHSESVGWY